MRRNALYGGTEWTKESVRILNDLVDRLNANPNVSDDDQTEPLLGHPEVLPMRQGFSL